MIKQISSLQDAAIGIVMHPKHADWILWTKRRDLSLWVLPGGGIELDEDPIKAIIREVKEESGIEVTVLKEAAVYTPLNRLCSKTHVFLCQATSSFPSQTEETEEACFFPFSVLPKPYFPLHAKWLNEIRENPIGRIERPITEISWLSVITFFLKHPILLSKYLFLRIGLRFL